MSEMLDELDKQRAFEPNRRFQDLPLYHVPFDELSGKPTTEAVLARAIEIREGAAVVGPAGCGKSSVIASVLESSGAEGERGLTPVRIVLAGDDEVARDAKRFAQQLITTIVDAAPISDNDREELRRSASDREQRQGKATTWHGSLGAPKWFLNADVARDVQKFSESLDRDRSAGELITSAQELFATLRAQELEPILILDDTDTWLNVPGHEKRDVADVFFAEVFRPVVRELACAAIAAVHPSYRDIAGYQAARDLLVNEALIPAIDDPELATASVSRVLAHIVDVHDGEAGADDLFAPAALNLLGGYYVERQAMRDVLLVVQRAVKETISGRGESITEGVIDEAIRYWAEARP
jgi:hypothetical protein